MCGHSSDCTYVPMYVEIKEFPSCCSSGSIHFLKQGLELAG